MEKTQNNETILYQGNILEIVQKIVGEKIFEIARRSPWIRLLITKGNSILLTKERRQEHNAYDYRLPGGKVFDTLAAFNEKLAQGEDIFTYAEIAAKKECKEETWLTPTSLTPLTTSKAWATVEWDLYYFLVNTFEENEQGQELEDGEDITVERRSREEVKTLCIQGDIREERTVGVLLKFLLKNWK